MYLRVRDYCHRKRSYATAGGAWHVIERMEQQQAVPANSKHVYLCPNCWLFHIGKFWVGFVNAGFVRGKLMQPLPQDRGYLQGKFSQTGIGKQGAWYCLQWLSAAIMRNAFCRRAVTGIAEISKRVMTNE